MVLAYREILLLENAVLLILVTVALYFCYQTKGNPGIVGHSGQRLLKEEQSKNMLVDINLPTGDVSDQCLLWCDAHPIVEGKLKTWCEVCKIEQGQRVGHCRLCNVCIDRRDHHCIW